MGFKSSFRWGILIVLLSIMVLLIHFHSQVDIKKEKFTHILSHEIEINPDITIDVIDNTENRMVDFKIIVITYNRPRSLQRLLDSLNQIITLNDTVEIQIWIDRSKTGEIDQTTFQVANTFKCRIGRLYVFNHTRHVGIYGQWMNTWQPTDQTNEIALILEDDITVSPYVYTYLKIVHAKYDSIKYVNGYSLQCSMKHGGGKGNLAAPKLNKVFLYPIIGTWGFSPKKENWIQFTEWYKIASKQTNFQPLVPGILPSSWYKHFLKIGKADTMWEMWHIYFAWKHQELTLYPNLPNCQGFTKNWREIGLHHQMKGEDKIINYWDNKLNEIPLNPIILDVNGNIVKL